MLCSIGWIGLVFLFRCDPHEDPVLDVWVRFWRKGQSHLTLNTLAEGATA